MKDCGKKENANIVWGSLFANWGKQVSVMNTAHYQALMCCYIIPYSGFLQKVIACTIAALLPLLGMNH